MEIVEQAMDQQPEGGADEGRRLQRLLREQRFRELRLALDDRLDGLEEGEEARLLLGLRGELAWRGHGPASDAVLAALEVMDVEPGGAEPPPLVVHAVQAAARARAGGAARALLERAMEIWPGDEQLCFVDEQLRSGWLAGQTRPQWRALELLDKGDAARARQRLQEMVEKDHGTVEERQWALLRLADLRRVGGEYAEAARLRGLAVELCPSAEDAVLQRLSGALDLWAAGDPAAVDRLRRLRHATKDGQHTEQRFAHHVAGDLLTALDSETAAPARPRWTMERGPWQAVNEVTCPGRAALVMLLRTLGLHGDCEAAEQEDSPLPTMAHLRYELSGLGAATARLRPDRALMEAALESDALLLLEEERPRSTGFLLLVGVEPVAELLLLKDPRRLAPLFRSEEDQRGRSALYGGGALLVARPGEEGRRLLDELGARDDQQLDLVDRCNLDEQGRVPAQARIAALAEEGIAAAPDLPMLHRRRGESLLEQVRMGNVEFGSAGPFERWLATARHRFPDAEWPFQIYARALEMQERFDEAGIAWSDAMNLDPRDERNMVGQARVLGQQGRSVMADQMLRQALIIRQDQPAVLARRAELALGREYVAQAGLYAAMANEMDPSDLDALMSLASVEERSRRPEEAIKVLERVVLEDAEHVPARTRLLHHRVHRGEWGAAGELAAEVRALIPGHANVWEAEAWVSWCAGQPEPALDFCMTGLQRCGPQPGLLEMVVQVLATSLPVESAAGALEQLTELLAATPAALLDLASGLSKREWHHEAIQLAEFTRQLAPRDPNPCWRLTQILLGAGTGVDNGRIDALLEETVGGAGPFPFPRVILAWRLLADDPGRSLELLAEANVAHAPGPVWSTQARALERLGREEEAAQIWSRLPETFPGGVLESMGLLAELGLHELCDDLLQRLLRQMPMCHEASVELARLRGLAGDLEGRLSLLLEVEAENESVVPLPMLLDAAAEAGDWEVVGRAARQILSRVERNSRSSYDAWPVRARLAGAGLAQGDERPRRQVLRLAPRHPGVLQVLCEAERSVNHPALAEDLQRLREAAPGLVRTLEDGP